MAQRALLALVAHEPLDLREADENEAFALAQIYARRESLVTRDQNLVVKLAEILFAPRPSLPGLIKVGFKRGREHSKQELHTADAYATQGGEDPEESKLYMPETEEETDRALEHYDNTWKRAHRGKAQE